jgi:hypothetical protein
MGTGDPFPGDKAQPENDADQSPPSSANVNEQELQFLFPLRLHGGRGITFLLNVTLISF